MRWAVILAICLSSASLARSETNTWLGITIDWADGDNWYSGTPPSAENGSDLLIPATEKGIYPVLSAATVVGGTLTIARDGQLSLNGHNLETGRVATDGQSPCLTIERGAKLFAGPGAPTITIHAGIVNNGSVRGKPKLKIAGRTSTVLLDGTQALELAELSTSASFFPYQILAKGSIAVEGNLILGGGRLVVQSENFVVREDLFFRGMKSNVILVPENDLILHGTIRSEGSAYCVEVPGSIPKWSQAEERAFCQLSPKAGWVRMVGKGDQTISPGGILPPIALDKPSGKVRLSGNLHCNGLFIKQNNTLQLSKGQKLIFGHHLREFASNPELNARPRHGPTRTCRDLINYGVITGVAEVPMSFLLNDKANLYIVEASYRGPAKNTDIKPEKTEVRPDMSGVMFTDFPEKAPGSVSVNRSGGRIQVRNGKLLLDGKPYKSKSSEEIEHADDIDLEEERPGESEKVSPDKPRATLTSLRLVKAMPSSFKVSNAFSNNIATYAERIAIPPRGPVIWAVNGNEWSDIYDMVDGDLGGGYRGAGYSEYIFPDAVRIGAVRVISSSSITSANQFIVKGDTNGDGRAEALLAWKRGGVAPVGSWMTWGNNWVEFPAVKIHRLRFQALSAAGKPIAAGLNEIEIYADRQSNQRLQQQKWLKSVSKFPDNARFLGHGNEEIVDWPKPAPENVVHKTASTAFWMFGVSGDVWKKSPHLRDYSQFVKVLDEIKSKYRFDIVTIFYEGVKGFHWPSLNFKSETNADYLKNREAALAMREAFKSKKKETEDEFDEVTEEEPEDDGLVVISDVKAPAESEKYSEELKIEDLPCQRNLMAELCEEAHKRGMKVHVICRPEDVGASGAYMGPAGKDAYELFLLECAAAGVDGFSLTPDEESMLWTASRHPDWREFHKARKERSKSAEKRTAEVEEKRTIVERAKLAGRILKKRMEAVRKINPKAEFFTSGARLLSGGDPYDIIGHIADPDYIGCHYQAHITRRWAATTRNRKVKMGEYAHRDLRWPIQAMLQGARLISTYRYNYIKLQKSEDHRVRENTFIDQFVRWGGTRSTRPPIALLVSRASERWWPIDCGKGLTGSDQVHRAWAVPEVMYGFLMRNGYTFDVYYLDQVDDLQALENYPLIIAPFSYSIPRAAYRVIEEAYKAGANLLVCERKGEVDELGRKHDQPLLERLIAEGIESRRTLLLDEDLVSLESRRSFVPKLTSVIDGLLGQHKDLYLNRYGNKIEAMVFAISPVEQYVTFTNWNQSGRRAHFTIGLNLPKGVYKILTLSSYQPSIYREAMIRGRKIFDAEMLRDFHIKLTGGEVLALYVLPAARRWGR